MSLVTKDHGPGALIQMGSTPIEPVETVSTGSIGVDNALGIGGLPRGRVVEIYGPEGTGKTTLALHAIANVQKAGGLAVMIDAEHAMDLKYARRLGVDTEKLMLSQPDSGEQALEIADICVRSKVVDIVVIDSVAALVPKAEIAGEMGDSHPGMQARLMSQALRKMTGAIGSTKTTCIFINQLREKIGVFYGNPEVTAGGKALKFYASVRIDVRKTELIKDGTVVVGHKVRVKIVKNKLSPPFREYIAKIIYGIGFSKEAELIELGVEQGVLHKGGAYYSYGSEMIGQGAEKARQYLEEHPDVAAEIEVQVRARLAGTITGAQVASGSIVSAAPANPLDLLGGSTGSLADLVPLGGNDPDTQ
jgi:recombination protein RecA